MDQTPQYRDHPRACGARTAMAADNRKQMMILTRLLAATALILASALAVQACEKHGQQAMSCADGTAWDAETGTCMPQTTS